MTNEEMQRTMNFIVEQQAQSSAKIDAPAGAQARNPESIEGLFSIAEIHEREINTLGETTDGCLNALINVVERQINEGHNGKS
jgi:hypothetical protein